jgi:hypothetical protein
MSDLVVHTVQYNLPTKTLDCYFVVSPRFLELTLRQAAHSIYKLVIDRIRGDKGLTLRIEFSSSIVQILFTLSFSTTERSRTE